MTKITAYKGFNADWTCRDFQFEVGETYTHDGDVRICGSGFHACENPMDVWGYYGPCDVKYALVSMEGDADKKESGDSKIAAGKITIEAEISAGEFVKKCVDWIVSATKGKNEDSGYSAQIGSSGNYAQIGSSGYSARIGSSGYYAQIGSSGNYAQIGSSGDYARIGSSGNYAQIGSSGYSAQIGSSGNYAQIGSSGYYAQIGSSGNYAQIGSSGYYAQIDVSGERSVVASAGYNATVRGPNGTWVSVAEYDNNGECIGFASGCIGKGGLKADVWYKAKDGKLVEVSS
jgi:hypothetical protein